MARKKYCDQIETNNCQQKYHVSWTIFIYMAKFFKHMQGLEIKNN